MEGFMRSSSYFKTLSLILICLLSSNGCAVYVAAVGTPGDLSSVSSSFPLAENRKDVEEALGSPDKKCPRTSNEEQIIYYYFDEGQPPASEEGVGYIDPKGILGYVACEILTFGICGVVIGSAMMYADGPNGLMTIVYDKNDIVVKYSKYSRNELAYSYGPKGYERGILDCVDIEGEYDGSIMQATAQCYSRCDSISHQCINAELCLKWETNYYVPCEDLQSGAALPEKIEKSEPKKSEPQCEEEKQICFQQCEVEAEKEKVKEVVSEKVEEEFTSEPMQEDCDPGMESCPGI
jgi:hypothetical protein